MKSIRKGKQHRIKTGAPSGFVISLIFHVAVFFLAGLFVVFTVINKSEPEFEAPPPIERPKMKLKKPKVKVRKSSQPKPSSRIVAKVQMKKMPEIQLPDLEGFGDGLMDGIGTDDSFLDMPDLSKSMSIFGKEESIGSDFVGQVYHLKYNRNRGPASMDEDSFRFVLANYVQRGWDDSILEKYYQLPKKLYATYFAVSGMPSTLCTEAFGGGDLECYWIFAVYKGKLVYKEDIRFRFWGIGDAYIFVNVDGKEVLLNTWRSHKDYFNWWEGKDSKHLIYMLGNQNMAVGDWIDLKAGQPVDMKVLFGEWAGGSMSGILLVEVEGEKYPKSHWNGPLLPLFKTQELTWDDLTEIYKYLPEDECSLTNGPVFSDIDSSGKGIADAREADASPVNPSSGKETGLRRWTLNDGRVVEAVFKQMLFNKAVLEDENGNEIKVALDEFCDEDLTFVQLQTPPKLDIEFAPLSRQRVFPPTIKGETPIRGLLYTFCVKIRQVSGNKSPYRFPLTAEFFAIGQQIGEDTRVLLERQTADLSLSKENDFSFTFQGEEIQLLDYTTNDERRGTRYDGYLVVIRDINGRIIAHKTSSNGLFTNLDNLSRLKVGWHFDDHCRRALPVAPQHFQPHVRDRHKTY